MLNCCNHTLLLHKLVEVFVCMYVYVCMCVYVHVCIVVNILLSHCFASACSNVILIAITITTNANVLFDARAVKASTLTGSELLRLSCFLVAALMRQPGAP